ncbi:alpha/beta fold hydrolase [Nocardioides sp.]|uniref:alpha/beta fold hydrolase n=1 Tax=Nocardioides sp. TaxID=35761 RepID=UPI003D12B70F
MGSPYDVQYVTLHGHRRAFVKAGSGPVLLLLHGLGCDHTTWDPVIERLSESYTVIAPDLLGHGSSDKPRADYSVGGYANGMRDLITVLGIDKVTVVGHSFGGGVAMQFGYQFPERTQRVILVSSGGLGPEVTPAIKAITTPGFYQAMGVVTLPVIRHVTTAAMRLMSRSGLPHTRDLDEMAEIVETFRDPRSRAAISHVVKSVVDWRGQIVTMSDRAYLTEAMPLLLIWGDQDTVIPAAHLDNAATLAPGLRTEMVADSGHFPHKDHPEQFVAMIDDFMATTDPAVYSRVRFRAMLKAGAPHVVAQAEAGQAPIPPLRALHEA